MNGRGWQAMAALVALVALILSGCASQSGSAQAGVSTESTYGGSSGAAMGMGPDSGSGRSGGSGMGRGPSPREFVAVIDLKDIHFAFDRAEIGPEAATMLDVSAQWLKENPRHLLLIEGHADERGTNEYNLALGDRRAKATMNYLVSVGVRANRISIISYGEEQPMCREHSEDCWTMNRRAHFGIKQR
jgi:peptidoglycan-associated lipoprotein